MAKPQDTTSSQSPLGGKGGNSSPYPLVQQDIAGETGDKLEGKRGEAWNSRARKAERGT